LAGLQILVAICKQGFRFSIRFYSIYTTKGKSMYYRELTQNQLRVAVDLRQTYEAYREARRNQGKLS